MNTTGELGLASVVGVPLLRTLGGTGAAAVNGILAVALLKGEGAKSSGLLGRLAVADAAFMLAATLK